MLYNVENSLEIYGKHQWKPSNIAVLDFLTKSTNQVLQKHDDGSIGGLRYVVSPEPSTLRPIRSWTINVEHWLCDERANIEAKDIMFIRLLNDHRDIASNYSDITQDIVIMNKKIDIDLHNAFNSIMAVVMMIGKIDSGRMPDVEKILSSYNMSD